MSTLNFMPHAVGQSQERFPYAQVVAPAPASPTDPMYVVMPDWSDVHIITIQHIPMIYGNTLPTVGTSVMLGRIRSEVAAAAGVPELYCAWWAGVWTTPDPGV